MENADLQVLSQLQSWIQAGDNCWLCTVIETWGSSPRPVGSLLACNDKGKMVGSLSGGCIEDDLLEKLNNQTLGFEQSQVILYGETKEESDRFGLPCGGKLHVLIESFTDQAHLPPINEIITQLRARQCIERTVDLKAQSMSVKNSTRFKNLSITGDLLTGPNEISLTQTYGPRFQLFLIGAGQVSIFVAEMAKALDYHVIVCDPRQEIVDQWPVDGIQLLNMMPDDAVSEFATDEYSAIIALTHDPRIDDMGLMQALKTDAFFVGAMGSTRTSAKRRERLLQLDLTEAEISRLHGPVGLSIGSKTPAEIAIAILAQLTQIRAEHAKSQTADTHKELEAN